MLLAIHPHLQNFQQN